MKTYSYTHENTFVLRTCEGKISILKKGENVNFCSECQVSFRRFIQGGVFLDVTPKEAPPVDVIPVKTKAKEPKPNRRYKRKQD